MSVMLGQPLWPIHFSGLIGVHDGKGKNFVEPFLGSLCGVRIFAEKVVLGLSYIADGDDGDMLGHLPLKALEALFCCHRRHL